jgi:chemotaxis protein methyltransferase CheR
MQQEAIATGTTMSVREHEVPDLRVEREFHFTKANFERVRALIHERAGIALTSAKENMVYSRLSRRLRAKGLSRFDDYLALLESSNTEEWEAFVNSLTTNLTSFFREEHHFPVLAELLRAQPRGAAVRIWCTAASTGEEPYSLAITACEAFGTLTPPVRIVASDIDTQVLATGARGVYSEDRWKGLDPARLKRFFLRGTGQNAGKARVRPELQALIDFRSINLLAADWAVPGDLTAIFCRNVMIYFDRPTQYQILARFAPLLAPGGLLFAGHSESFQHANKIFRLRGKTIYERV